MIIKDIYECDDFAIYECDNGSININPLDGSYPVGITLQAIEALCKWKSEKEEANETD